LWLQSERKIDHFEGRLAGIERMLRDLTTTLSANRQPGSSESPARPHEQVAHDHTVASSVAGDDTLYGDGQDDDIDDQDDNVDSPFEGTSSMTAQTVFASEFIEHAVTQDGFSDLDPRIQAALSSLKQIVHMQNRTVKHESRFPNAKPLPKGGFRELPMPPMKLVLKLLRLIKGKRMALGNLKLRDAHHLQLSIC